MSDECRGTDVERRQPALRRVVVAQPLRGPHVARDRCCAARCSSCTARSARSPRPTCGSHSPTRKNVIALRELARTAVRGQSPGFPARPPDVDQAAQPLLHPVPLPDRDRAAVVAVPAAPRPLPPVPKPDGVRDIRGARHPPGVPARAAAHDDRLRRHHARVRPEHLPEEHRSTGCQPDRGDAVAALRLGDDRCHRGDHRARHEVALAGDRCTRR